MLPSPKSGLMKSSAEGLGRANQDENARDLRGSRRREAIILTTVIALVFVGLALVELLG